MDRDRLEERLLEIPVIRNKNWIMFAEEYANTLDYKESYRRVFPRASEVTCTTAGWKLLQVDEIKQYIDFILLNNLRNVKIGTKPSNILREIQKMAYSSEHKYPNVKKDALKMLLDLYNGEILEEFDRESKAVANQIKDRNSNENDIIEEE